MHIREPEMMKNPFWNYVVLVLSMVFEGTSLVISIKEFNKTRNGLGWWDSIIKSKDPSSFLVVFEDGAAVAGLAVVMILMGIGHAYGIPELDGVASVIVGLILIFVSSILARESRSLLMGEGITPETRQKISKFLEDDPAVIRIKTILSTYQSPEEVVLVLIIDFEDHLETEEITDAILRIRNRIKQEYPLVRFVIVQPD